MLNDNRGCLAAAALAGAFLFGLCADLAAAGLRVEGQVRAGGGPVDGSAVTLWAASADAPVRLAEAKTDADGHFALSGADALARAILYLVAKGGAPAGRPTIRLDLARRDRKRGPRARRRQRTDDRRLGVDQRPVPRRRGDARRCARPSHRLRQRAELRRPSNRRLRRRDSGCAERRPDADDGQFRHAGRTPRRLRSAGAGECVRQPLRGGRAAEGAAPTDTLAAAEAIARYPGTRRKNSSRCSTVLSGPGGEESAAVPYMPYLDWAPSAFVLPLKFDGGGYRAGGKAMFDSEGNLWVPDNFTVGWQGQDSLWEGHATKFAPNGKPLSPITTGFSGGGMEGGTFGNAVDAKDNAWFTTYGSKAIAVFDKTGKPLTPPEGITFGGRLGLMQGIIATPGGDVWAVGVEKSQLVRFPGGDLAKGHIVAKAPPRSRANRSGRRFISPSTSRTASGCRTAASTM